MVCAGGDGIISGCQVKKHKSRLDKKGNGLHLPAVQVFFWLFGILMQHQEQISVIQAKHNLDMKYFVLCSLFFFVYRLFRCEGIMGDPATSGLVSTIDNTPHNNACYVRN